MDGVFADVGKVCQDVVVGYGARQFQITVGDSSLGVFIRLELSLDVMREWLPPKVRVVRLARCCRWQEDNTAHAGTRGVAGANGRGCGWRGLGNSCWSGGKLGCQPPEIVKKIVDGVGEA